MIRGDFSLDSIELTDRNKTMEDFNDESTKFV